MTDKLVVAQVLPPCNLASELVVPRYPEQVQIAILIQIDGYRFRGIGKI